MIARREPVGIFFVGGILLLAGGTALAHPVAQGTLDVEISTGSVRVSARVSMEEVIVSNTQGTAPPPSDTQEAVERHGYYLLQHIRLHADGIPVEGRLVSAAEDASAARDHALYEFVYDFPKNQPEPARLRIEQSVLSEFDFAPGNPWEAFYLLRMGMEGGGKLEGLLSGKNPVMFVCTWTASARPAKPPAARAEAGWIGQVLLLAGVALGGVLAIYIFREQESGAA